MKAFLRSATMRGATGVYAGLVGFLIGKAVSLRLGGPCPADVYTALKDQGSLIAGLLAVGAAWMTVRGTMRAAERQIAAAREQTAAAHRQADVVLMLDRSHTMNRDIAFALSMASAVSIVLDEVMDALNFAAQVNGSGGLGFAYKSRRAIKKIGFDELRAACIQLGGNLVAEFLNLDSQISRLSGKTREVVYQGVTSGSAMAYEGELFGLEDELRSIEKVARELHDLSLDEAQRLIKEMRELREGTVGLHSGG